MIGVTVLISTCMYGLLFMIPLNSRMHSDTGFGRSYNKFTSKYVHCKLLLITTNTHCILCQGVQDFVQP